MSHQDRRPPSCATWLLERFSDSYRRDALLGDLIEQYRGGRSDAWYWRQALVVVLIAVQCALWCRIRARWALLAWWSALVILAFTFKSAVLLLLILDPGPCWLLYHRRKTRRSPA